MELTLFERGHGEKSGEHAIVTSCVNICSHFKTNMYGVCSPLIVTIKNTTDTSEHGDTKDLPVLDERHGAAGTHQRLTAVKSGVIDARGRSNTSRHIGSLPSSSSGVDSSSSRSTGLLRYFCAVWSRFDKSDEDKRPAKKCQDIDGDGKGYIRPAASGVR